MAMRSAAARSAFARMSARMARPTGDSSAWAPASSAPHVGREDVIRLDAQFPDRLGDSGRLDYTHDAPVTRSFFRVTYLSFRGEYTRRRAAREEPTR